MAQGQEQGLGSGAPIAAAPGGVKGAALCGNGALTAKVKEVSFALSR